MSDALDQTFFSPILGTLYIFTHSGPSLHCNVTLAFGSTAGVLSFWYRKITSIILTLGHMKHVIVNTFHRNHIHGFIQYR